MVDILSRLVAAGVERGVQGSSGKGKFSSAIFTCHISSSLMVPFSFVMEWRICWLTLITFFTSLSLFWVLRLKGECGPGH